MCRESASGAGRAYSEAVAAAGRASRQRAGRRGGGGRWRGAALKGVVAGISASRRGAHGHGAGDVAAVRGGGVAFQGGGASHSGCGGEVGGVDVGVDAARPGGITFRGEARFSPAAVRSGGGCWGLAAGCGEVIRCRRARDLIVACGDVADDCGLTFTSRADEAVRTMAEFSSALGNRYTYAW